MLQGRAIVKRGVGPPGVVPALLLDERPGDGRDGQVPGPEGPELQAQTVVAALHLPVPLGAAWRQGEQRQFPRLALGLEPGHELRTPVHLDGLDRERHVRQYRLEEPPGVPRRGAGEHPADHDAADRIDRPELLERLPVAADRHVVDPHEFAGALRLHTEAPATGDGDIERDAQRTNAHFLCFFNVKKQKSLLLISENQGEDPVASLKIRKNLQIAPPGALTGD